MDSFAPKLLHICHEPCEIYTYSKLILSLSFILVNLYHYWIEFMYWINNYLSQSFFAEKVTLVFCTVIGKNVHCTSSFCGIIAATNHQILNNYIMWHKFLYNIINITICNISMQVYLRRFSL